MKCVYCNIELSEEEIQEHDDIPCCHHCWIKESIENYEEKKHPDDRNYIWEKEGKHNGY